MLATDATLENLALKFWGIIADRFPEMTSGDSQISGEDEAAIATWLNGDPGDRPVQKSGVLCVDALQTRANDAVDAAIALIRKDEDNEIGRDPGEPNTEVVDQLRACVQHVLFYNFPREAEDEDDGPIAAMP